MTEHTTGVMGSGCDGVQLYCGDSREITPRLPDSSIDLIVEDWPYFRVKDEWWDRQWNDEAAFLEWVGTLLEERQRLLAPNGSLYVFASPQMSARIECEVHRRFCVVNRIRWVKEAGWHKKAVPENLRSYLSPWEEIVFAEHHGADNYAKGEAGYVAKCDELRGFVFEPLRAYLAEEWERAGLKFAQANEACNTASMAARHFFSRSQWCLPTKEHYHALRAYANSHNHGGSYLRREYEDLRRPFSVTPERPYTDVWEYPTVQAYPGKHPCEKPLAMMEHIILTSSRPGDVVADFFMGHGTTAVAAQQQGRRFVGGDISAKWVEAARRWVTRPVQLALV